MKQEIKSCAFGKKYNLKEAFRNSDVWAVTPEKFLEELKKAGLKARSTFVRLKKNLIHGYFIGRISNNIDFDNVICIFQQLATIPTKMSKVQFFTLFRIAFG